MLAKKECLNPSMQVLIPHFQSAFVDVSHILGLLRHRLAKSLLAIIGFVLADYEHSATILTKPCIEQFGHQ